MANKYKVKLTKAHLHLKKGKVLELSRDIASLYVHNLKVAQYVSETEKKK